MLLRHQALSRLQREERIHKGPSGVRLGAPAGTTRGFGTEEFRTIGKLIAEVVDGMAAKGPEGDSAVEDSVRRRVSELCAQFPVYPGR